MFVTKSTPFLFISVAHLRCARLIKKDFESRRDVSLFTMLAAVRHVRRELSGAGGSHEVTVDTRVTEMGYRWLRFTLIATNVVVWLLGLSLLVAGCLLIVDQDVKEVTHNFDIFDNYRVAGVFTIVVGTCLSCVGFLGCCGALFLNGCLLLTYIMLMAVFLVLEFTVMGLVWKHANVYELEENVSEAFRKLILKSRNGIFAVEMFLDRVQQDLKCCGGHGPDDYILLEMDCSAGCFYYTSGEVVTYSQGCGKAVSDFLMGKSLAIGLVCLFIILIQLFAVGCAVYLYLDQRNKKPTPV